MARAHFRDTLRAEFTKALSLRSIQATIAAALVVPGLLALASGFAFDPDRRAQFPLVSQGFETAGFGQPLVILLAALIVGTEYLDGQLRTTLIATPNRGRVLSAKVFIIAVLSAGIGLISISLSVLMKHAALGEYGMTFNEVSAGMIWNLVGVAVNYMLIALIAASITLLARTFIVTLAVLIPMVLGVTVSLVSLIPLLKFLPDLAGIQLLMEYPGLDVLDPLPGAAVMTIWTFALCGTAWFRFRSRDTLS